jgi:hypothetical protein
MLILKRCPEYLGATPGHLFYEGEYFKSTLELPWRGNAQDISCIPPGLYEIAFTHSPKFKRVTLEILNVPNREGIRCHPANHVRELLGCIAPVTLLSIAPLEVIGERSLYATEALEALVRKNRITALRIESPS